MRDSVPSVRYSSVCNVLLLWNILLVPTYTIVANCPRTVRDIPDFCSLSRSARITISLYYCPGSARNCHCQSFNYNLLSARYIIITLIYTRGPYAALPHRVYTYMLLTLPSHSLTRSVVFPCSRWTLASSPFLVSILARTALC